METITMLAEISDSPNEAALEGASELTDQLVQFIEAKLNSPGQAQSLFQGDMTGRMPPGFSQVSVGAESISFAPGPEAATALPGMDGGSIGLGPMGDQMSSLIQSVMQMPGPMGLLSQFFQFLSSLFSSMLRTFDPSMLAQQAQGALDLKNLMQN